MKSILVATDFSENAHIAAEYAVLLAKEVNASVTLFHSYSILFPAPNIPKEISAPDEYGKAVENELQKLATSLGHTDPQVKVDYICKPGFPVEDISKLVAERNFDLVVMGIKGMGFLKEILAGSVTTDLIIKASFPVLVVPVQARFRPIKRIVFACDCRELYHYEFLHLLKEIAKHFESRIIMLHIIRDEEIGHSVEKEATRCRMEEYFDGMPISFHEVEENNLTDALNEFANKTNAELTVMIPRRHSFFESIFSGSSTKELAFHTHIPLLALPDKD